MGVLLILCRRKTGVAVKEGEQEKTRISQQGTRQQLKSQKGEKPKREKNKNKGNGKKRKPRRLPPFSEKAIAYRKKIGGVKPSEVLIDPKEKKKEPKGKKGDKKNYV